MKSRIRRVLNRLTVFYGGWRGIVVAGGVLIILLAALTDLIEPMVSVLAVWFLTLLLIGAQRPPTTTIVTTEVETAKPPVSVHDRGPLVTIVVPTYNEGEYLTHCLTSVANQTHSRLECLVIDDASTDGSLDAAAEAVSGDARFKVITNPRNLGLAASRNVGLNAASGSFITFLDGDDFLYSRAIGERLAVFGSANDNGSLGGAFCNWQMVPETEIPGSEPATRPLRRNVTWLGAVEDNPFIASAPLILTETARAVGGFDEGRNTAEDFDFWARYLRHGYALRASQYVGIAYRQKMVSMYRSTILDHVDIQLDVYGFNFRPMRPDEIRPGTPFVFTEEPAVYQQQLMQARRLLVGFTVATHDRNETAARDILHRFKKAVRPWMLWAENWEAVVQRTSKRLEAYDTEGAEVRTLDLAQRVELALLPILMGASPPAFPPA
jgi:glycosyltransferase involved in cell wall biosynthesis